MKTVAHIENILKKQTLMAQSDVDFFKELLIALKSENHSSDAEWREEGVNRVLNKIITLLEPTISPKKIATWKIKKYISKNIVG